MLVRAGRWARQGFGRCIPEPFVIAIALTAVVAVAGVLRGTDPRALVEAWGGGGGLWALLSFTMQMCVMLVLGTALASAPAVQSATSSLIGRARNPRQLVGITAAVSIVLALMNWSLGLVGGALLARAGGQLALRRNWSLHYPLLCAAGYSGMMTWHGGFSGSAPLKVTTAKDLSEVLGPELAQRIGVLELSETLFSPLNLFVSGGLLVLGPVVFMAMTPRAQDSTAVPAPRLDAQPGRERTALADPDSLLERCERSRWFNGLLAAGLLGALALTLSTHGLSRLSFNTVNLALWACALLLHARPQPFMAACEEGARSCAGVILQFPLYAGIMGMMTAAGLSGALSELFAQAGAGAFSVVSFLSAGLLNLFVPSGGGQWAVQGPILMRGALALDLAPGEVVMAMAYGDQWTNMLQPFWALPLLALTRVRARDIIGYAAIWMAFGGLWIVGGLLIIGGV